MFLRLTLLAQDFILFSEPFEFLLLRGQGWMTLNGKRLFACVLRSLDPFSQRGEQGAQISSGAGDVFCGLSQSHSVSFELGGIRSAVGHGRASYDRGLTPMPVS